MVDRARRWLSTGIRDSIGHVHACTVNEKGGGETSGKKHEKDESTNARAPGDTRRSSWRSAQLKRRRAATARLLPPAAALRAYNEANRATALARGCSPRFGPIRRRSPFSASHPRYFLAVFEELRPPARTSHSRVVTTYIRGSGSHDPPSRGSDAHPCTAHPTSYRVLPVRTFFPPLRVSSSVFGSCVAGFWLYSRFCELVSLGRGRALCGKFHLSC